MDQRRTLIIPLTDTHILLGYKKRGFGEGKITAFGGKLEASETLFDGARRELEEETGLLALDIQPAGEITFTFPARPEWNLTVFVFVAYQWQGHLRESDEVAPKWYSHDKIPYDEMWDDARYWLPEVLAGRTIKARFTFANDNEIVVDYSVSAL
ncbi:MAG: 8-oxo-dGTP diphosphatase [Chloroflexi bacterium]|nr:8-oxo-dGTP diphosphatase [Chloroflexota bacterium]